MLAPQLMIFGTFTRRNDNAGGSVICIHKDLREEVIVTHFDTSRP